MILDSRQELIEKGTGNTNDMINDFFYKIRKIIISLRRDTNTPLAFRMDTSPLRRESTLRMMEDTTQSRVTILITQIKY